MASDPDIIQAIEAALSADPTNSVLRVHLAGLMLDAGRAQDALGQLELVLQREPDHLEALGLAARAGSVVGDARSAGWARLHESLSGMSSGSPSVGSPDAGSPSATSAGGGSPSDPIVGAAGAPSPDPVADVPAEEADWDGFLQRVLTDAGYEDRVTLADVGGLHEVKERLEQSFLAPMRNPELRRQYGARLRGGLLLWGPPGCGKTFLARAVAGELGAHFVTVGLPQILDMWVGNSEKQLHELFEVSRRKTPCVLFFDELDAIGHSRMSLGRGAARNVVAQLLVELDGVETPNEGIFVIGATNQPWDVDPALRRPGRFDRTMLLLPPDAGARAAILRYHLRGRPLGAIDFDELAAISDGLSGADLRLVCEEAAERALGEAIRTSVPEPISAEDLRRAMISTRPSTAAWFESARNHVRYANEAGEYDELADHLRQRRSR